MAKDKKTKKVEDAKAEEPKNQVKKPAKKAAKKAVKKIVVSSHPTVDNKDVVLEKPEKSKTPHFNAAEWLKSSFLNSLSRFKLSEEHKDAIVKAQAAGDIVILDSVKPDFIVVIKNVDNTSLNRRKLMAASPRHSICINDAVDNAKVVWERENK